MNLTPQHSQTSYALARAVYLADIYAPSSKPQQVAHQRLLEVIHSGDLRQTVAAMQAAKRLCLTGDPWASWCELWMGKVQRFILGEIEQKAA